MVIEAIGVSEEQFDHARWKGAHHPSMKYVHMEFCKLQNGEPDIEWLVDSELRLLELDCGEVVSENAGVHELWFFD